MYFSGDCSRLYTSADNRSEITSSHPSRSGMDLVNNCVYLYSFLSSVIENEGAALYLPGLPFCSEEHYRDQIRYTKQTGKSLGSSCSLVPISLKGRHACSSRYSSSSRKAASPVDALFSPDSMPRYPPVNVISVSRLYASSFWLLIEQHGVFKVDSRVLSLNV